jgi:dihydrofolate reductase
MGKLIYSAFTLLDGFVTDEAGNFVWAELDDEVHAFINSRERQIGTYLFGRKMYETMAVWETPDVLRQLPCWSTRRSSRAAAIPICRASERSR